MTRTPIVLDLLFSAGCSSLDVPERFLYYLEMYAYKPVEGSRFAMSVSGAVKGNQASRSRNSAWMKTKCKY